MEDKIKPVDALVGMRTDIKLILQDINHLELSFPMVAEVTLAQRHLEDARMRLGVALALLEGKDPLGNK